MLCAARAGEATIDSIVALADGVAADGVCTLREAIRAANSNVAVNECPAGSADDTVILAGVGTYPFALGAQIRLSANMGGAVVLDSVLVAEGSGDGIVAFRSGNALLLLGQVTATGNAHGGVYLGSSSLATPLPRLENSILWGNPGPGSAGFDLETSGETDTDRVGNHLWIGDQGDGDPLFVDAALGDYALQSISGALDAGEQAFGSVGPLDAKHSPRVAGPEVDLGAFERGGIFGDGFESGDTGFWTASVP